MKEFRDGVLTVKFNLIAGASDQTAGLAFGVTPQSEYDYARYNTKDGDVALWRFEGGERRRLADGTEHLQLALNAGHDLRVEVRGTRVVASVAGRVGARRVLHQARQRHCVQDFQRALSIIGISARRSRRGHPSFN